ncbi:MAG: ABC transporter ATP-binding protein [Hyphomonadaceae bacterium]|jgi:NitT/TauT family transport system ATP-binding protein|uniref:ABC transporter ATP-binding protein n=1 Tax=Aquidulcibacter sp. TaxID=2052990 RepID=UPI0022BC2105|nr:ATP-binding cassette domain-containing protein [Aquidulcibacter sp.]MCE2889965.1 ATP-binding cassette domain-containing protein [Hyphomonadaceae bacterium]MCZ8207726.1 ATP-binding cassette domain-containing protein [Aquidulcibacter sp.]
MPSESPIRLSAEQACVRFGRLDALGPIDLSVRAGECVVLLGPSGCGKSTLLAALAGLQAVASGKVQADATGGLDIPGVVFQEPNLMNWATAEDNVALPLALLGVDKDARLERAQAALKRVGLASFASAYPRTLSGGMRMRVALARALVNDPSSLLLDEPFAAIDELGRRALDDLVLEAKRDHHLAVLFVTHSVDEAVYLADRILVLSPRPGRIMAEIAVPNVPRDPAFLTSPAFADAAAAARRVLSAQLVAA